jgi:UDP-N-acetylglucosamine:LPS N-acetylglucosamine transferase
MANGTKRILAVSSGGGHWVQLQRLRSVFDGHDVAFVTVNPAYRHEVEPNRFYQINDATSWDKIGLIKMALRLLLIVLWEHPDILISTGAAPGFFAIRFGKLIGSKTVWIDSIANIERLSLSGQLVGQYADLWLTQWPHLAKSGGPKCKGGVL